MKGIKSTIAAFSVAVVLCASSAIAQTYPLYVSGGFQGWAPGTPADQMTLVSGTPGVDAFWSLSLSGQQGWGRQEFKVTENDWNWAVPNSGNSWYYPDVNGNVTITYDQNTYSDGWLPAQGRIGVSTDAGTWTAVGDWQAVNANEPGAGAWNNSDVGTAMTSIGGGVYEYTAVITTPGNYQYKAVNTGSWDAIGTDSRTVNAATYAFSTVNPNQAVEFELNPTVGDVTLALIPEPSTIALVVAGLLGAFVIRRRK